MKSLIPAILLLTAGLLLGSCTGTTVVTTFIVDDTVRLEIDGVHVFEYNDNECQLAFNATRCEFRAMKDNMLDYFSVTLDRIPERSGQKANAKVVWSSPDGEKAKKDITLEAKRIKGDVLWLCDAGGHTACVVRVLE